MNKKKNAQIGRRNEWTTAQHDSNVKQWRRWNRKRMEGTSWVQLFGAMLFLPNKMERKWTTWNEHLAKPKWKQQFQMATERERESASARSISMVWPKLECIAGCWMFCMFVFICTGKRLRRSYLTCACLPRFLWLWLWLILSSHFPLRFVQKYFSLLWWR